MPIKPENRTRYPKNWPAISRAIRERAGNRCEGSPIYPACRAENGKPHPVSGSIVVLTVAHWPDHNPENCSPDNLHAWCQRCHLTMDARDSGKSLGQRMAELNLRSRPPTPKKVRLYIHQWSHTRSSPTAHLFRQRPAKTGPWRALCNSKRVLDGAPDLNGLEPRCKRCVRAALKRHLPTSGYVTMALPGMETAL